MGEGASPQRWGLDKKLGEDASMEEKKTLTRIGKPIKIMSNIKTPKL